MSSDTAGKPGSVTTIICLDPVFPPGSSHLLKARGQRLCLSTMLLRVGFTRPVCLHTAGELLPRLFILTFIRR